jgi:hypothetical protein
MAGHQHTPVQRYLGRLTKTKRDCPVSFSSGRDYGDAGERR